jgi:hypothetical protein
MIKKDVGSLPGKTQWLLVRLPRDPRLGGVPEWTAQGQTRLRAGLVFGSAGPAGEEPGAGQRGPAQP